MQDELTTNLSAERGPGDLPRGSVRATGPSSDDPTAWDRFLKGLSHYYLQTKRMSRPRLTCSRRPSARPHACDRARLSRHHPGSRIQFGWIKGTAELWTDSMNLAESSVRLDPRSSFAFGSSPTCMRWKETRDGHGRGQAAVSLNPYDMGARGILGLCHFVSGEHRQAIELFSTAAQRGNNDPRYKWAAVIGFGHYLLGQYDASLSWAREQLSI